MTVTSTNQKVSFSGNGSTTIFAYNFKIFAQTDLLVILRSATGTETTQQLTSKYTVSGVGATSGGNVTMGTAPPSGTTLVIQRVQPQLQGLDLVPNDPFPAQSMEDALDKLVFNVQSLNEEVGRAIKASTTNTIGDTEFTISATDRANKLFSFDSSGNLSIAQELGTYKGDWAASTTYAVRDLVKDTSTNNIFICITAHTSSGSQPLTTNTDAAKWALIVDAASATTSQTAAAASATASANSATASASSASSSSTKADEAAASASTASTKAGEAATSATASASSATAAASSATAAASSATAAAASAADVAKVEGITNGTVSANKAMVVDSAKDITGGRNLTITGELDAATLDISGNVVVSGTVDGVDLQTLNTAVSANTSKTTNATHSGEVTGSGALTIADNIVDEANLKVSNSPVNGYMLTAQSGNTGGLTWAAAGGSGGLEFIASTDVNNASTANFTGFNSSKYDAYRFVFSNIVTVSDNVSLDVRTSSNGGSSYDSGSNNYKMSRIKGGSYLAYNATSFGVGVDIGSASGEDGCSGELIVFGPHLTKRTYLISSAFQINNSGASLSLYNTGYRDSSADVDALQFLAGSGNLESGTITMYGMVNS